MKNALEDAGVDASEVGYINAHGTGTPMNDKAETVAVKTAFGNSARSLVMSSTKSMTGHTLGASGAIEAILTAKALADKMAPPTTGENLKITYDSNIKFSVDEKEQREIFKNAMENSLSTDKKMRTTTRGPHKDDMSFFVNSQRDRKSVV